MALSIARATLSNILGVIGFDDILAGLSVVHDRLGVGEVSVEQPVENPGGEEGIHVADGEPVQVQWSAWNQVFALDVERKLFGNQGFLVGKKGGRKAYKC